MKADDILNMSPNLALLVIVGLGIFCVGLFHNRKTIKELGDGFYNKRKRSEEYKKMIENADTKICEHDENLGALNETVEDLKGRIDDYDTENHKHWDVSVEYRKRYDEQIARDEEKHDEIVAMQKQLSDTQSQLADAITVLTRMSTEREKQMEALREACKELLASEINKKYQRYLILGYIPADEYDEFCNSYRAYRGCNGNHTIESKFNYAIEHLPVQAMESRPILDKH